MLRDEGAAHAAKLRSVDVLVAAVRFRRSIQDFVMVNTLRDTRPVKAATAMGGAFSREALYDN